MSGKNTDGLETGFLAQSGQYNADDIVSIRELLEGISASGLETVRLVFADQHGVFRGKTITTDALESAFINGVGAPSTLLLKDTSQKTVFPVWEEETGVASNVLQGAADLLMVPDATSFTSVPWAPHSAWILCDTVYKSGEPISFSPRTVLKNAVDKLAAKNLVMYVGLEVEFHIFDMASLEKKEQGPHHFLSESTYSQNEEVLDELRRACQAMGLPIRTMEVEMGIGQFEFTFDPDTPLVQADNMMLFRTMVKELCAQMGLHATFMCQPKIDGAAASGWHLHQSLVDRSSGENVFMPKKKGELTPIADNWIAGLLKFAAESCLLTTPTINGYKRYQQFRMAPDRIQWGVDNRGSMIRGLMLPGDKASRIENRVAETAANPYFFFASQIYCGLAGIEGDLKAPPPVETPYNSDSDILPKSLIEAIVAFEQSELFHKEIGPNFVDYLSHIKRAEWDRYLMTVSQWEQKEYFDLF